MKNLSQQLHQELVSTKQQIEELRKHQRQLEIALEGLRQGEDVFPESKFTYDRT